MFISPVRAQPLTEELAALQADAKVSEEQRRIPAADEVPAPAFPGSRFCFHSSSGFFHTVLLLSMAPYQEVKAWYKEKLRWICVPYNEKDEQFNCISGSDTVSIQKATSSKACELDGLQTLIGIQYAK
ncbi:MAG: hypothetical protein Q9M29_00395 [Mariprofundaceae bacterium]|nr:hypothetical protein [Mariprofundaceae bacterium]